MNSKNNMLRITIEIPADTFTRRAINYDSADPGIADRDAAEAWARRYISILVGRARVAYNEYLDDKGNHEQ